MMNREFAMINGVSVDVTTVMDKTVKYVPTAEEAVTLVSKGEALLDHYLMNDEGLNDTVGLWKMFNENDGVFWEKKGWMIETFKRNPNYNGNYQIVLTNETVSRGMEYTNIQKFFDWIYEKLEERRYYEYEGKKLSYNEMTNILADLRKTQLNESTFEKRYAIQEKMDNLVHLKRTTEDEFFRAITIITESSIKHGVIADTLSDEDVVEKINDIANDYGIKFRTSMGQKVSKLISKTAAICGINQIVDIQEIHWIDQSGNPHSRTKDMGWNTQFAAFADAINPQEIKGRVVISCNPIDFWTMSFGWKWASCHTIDKENLRRAEGPHYSGCYCSGTQSYMCDESSFIVYTVDEKYCGDEFEMQDKIKRCVFYLGEDKLVQSRQYPDGRDGGDNTIAESMRKIVQRVVAELFGVPNYWTLKRGTSACAEVTESTGTHYRDYTSYNDCNVSFMKRIDGYKNFKRIRIGSDPICPSCGKTHYRSENVFCNVCENGVVCAECGCEISEEDAHWIDGEPYCDDCCHYCECCEEWTTNDGEYVESFYGGNWVCEYCLDNHFVWSSYDEEYIHRNDAIETYEGNFYREYSDGYRCCAECGEYHDVNQLQYDEETEDYYCEDCYNDLIEERENAEE